MEAVGLLAGLWRISVGFATLKITLWETLCLAIILTLTRLFAACRAPKLEGRVSVSDEPNDVVARAVAPIFLQRKAGISPLMNHSIAAQLFGESYIRDASLQKIRLEGADFGNVTSYFQEVVGDEMRGAQADKTNSLQPLNAAMKSVSEVEAQQKALTRPKFVQWVQKRILSLKPGERFTLPGGWTGTPTGHAMLYEVEKQVGDKFTMTALNLGPGREWHPSAVVGYRQKHIPALVQRDIPAAQMTLESVWECYYNLRYCKPRGNRPEDQHSANNVYVGFLDGIHPHFGRADAQQKEKEAALHGIPHQIAETSSADCWMAYMHATLPRGLSKSIEGRLRRRVLEEYFVYLNSQHLFWPTLSKHRHGLNSQIITERLAILRFAKHCQETYARSVRHAIDNKWISREEGDEALKSIALMQKITTESMKRYKVELTKLELAPSVTLQGLAAAAPVVIRPIAPAAYDAREIKQLEAKGAAAVAPIALSPTWPASGHDIKAYLEACHKQVKERASFPERAWNEPENKEDTARGREANSFCRRLFAEMPSVTDARLRQIRPGEKEACMVLISQLSEFFLRTEPYRDAAQYRQMDDVYHMQKVFAVMKFLSIGEYMGWRGLDIGNCCISFSCLSHSPEYLTPFNGFLSLTDPKIERELTDSLVFLRKAQADSGGMFDIPWQDYDNRHRDGETVAFPYSEEGFRRYIAEAQQRQKGYRERHSLTAEERNKRQVAETNEVLFVYQYLQANPEVQRRIAKKLQEKLGVYQKEAKEKGYSMVGSKEEAAAWGRDPLPMHAIVTEALMDLEGEFLPPAFCALKKQAFLTRSFVADAPEHYNVSSHSVRLTKDFYENGLCSIHLRLPNYATCRRPEATFASAHGEAGMKETRTKLIYGQADHNRQNDLMLRHEEPDRSRYLLASGENQSQWVLNTILYYHQHPFLLDDPVEQVLFEALVFERGVLRKQLEDHPPFANQLVDFVTAGYERAKALGKTDDRSVRSALFFLRTGAALEAYCKEMRIRTVKPFPQITEVLESLLKEGKLSEPNKALVVRELLAVYGRAGQLASDKIAPLLARGFFLSDHPIPSIKNPREGQRTHSGTSWSSPERWDPIPDNLQLDANVQQLHRNLSLALQAMEPKERNEILSTAVSNALGIPKPDVEWDMQGFPVVYSSDGSYKIDLGRVQLWSRDQSVAKLDAALQGTDGFARLFPRVETLTGLRSNGPSETHFTDQNGYENQVIQGYRDAHYRRKIPKGPGGKWCDLYPDALKEFPSKAIGNTTSAWQNPEDPKEIIFLSLETGKEIYRYDPRSSKLTCTAAGDARKDLTLTNVNAQNPEYARFKAFDPDAQFWVDAAGKIQVVELPTQKLQLQVTYEGDKVKKMEIAPPSDYAGYCYAVRQEVASLSRIPHYITFEHDSGERIVYLPVNVVNHSPDLTAPVAIKEAYQKDGHPVHAHVYKVDRKGNLLSSDLSGRLYYAYVLCAQRRYDAAQAIMNEQLSKLESYSAQEVEMFQLLLTLLSTSTEPKASALLLKALALLNDNSQKYGGIQPPQVDAPAMDAMLTNYLRHLPSMPTFALSREDEVLALATLQKGAAAVPLVVDRRLQELTQKEGAPALQSAEGLFVGYPSPDGIPGLDVQGWRPNPGFLDRLRSEELFDPQNRWPATHFFDAYTIAKDSHVDDPKRKKLAVVIRWLSSKQTAHQAAHFLQGVLADPRSYPSVKEFHAAVSEYTLHQEMLHKASRVGVSNRSLRVLNLR